jgi:hypothetical protein
LPATAALRSAIMRFIASSAGLISNGPIRTPGCPLVERARPESTAQTEFLAKNQPDGSVRGKSR